MKNLRKLYLFVSGLLPIALAIAIIGVVVWIVYKLYVAVFHFLYQVCAGAYHLLDKLIDKF